MLDFFHVYMYFLGQIDRDQICCNRYMMLYSSKPQHRESGLMCSGSMDDVDKTEHFLPETNNHPTLSIPHSGFCPLNGASIGPSLAALPFSATAAFPYIVCSISYFLLSCKMRLLHIGWKKKKVVNFCTTFKMNLQIMKKWVSPIRTHPWQGVTIPNPRSIKALRRNGYKTRSHLSHRFSGLFHYKIMPEPIWQKQIGIKTYESASSPDGATFPSIISTTI